MISICTIAGKVDNWHQLKSHDMCMEITFASAETEMIDSDGADDWLGIPFAMTGDTSTSSKVMSVQTLPTETITHLSNAQRRGLILRHTPRQSSNAHNLIV